MTFSLKAYKNDTRGNVAMMLAGSMFMLVGGLALAVDLSNSWFAKQRLQDTTDAIALLAAKDKTLTTTSELQAAANEYYAAAYPGEKGVRIVINSMVRDGDRVAIDASNNIDTYFTGIFNKSAQDVRVASSAVYAEKAMDIALVLDTTFSMSEKGKLSSLKVAANGLIDTIDDTDNDQIRLSVVPFAQYVNVGLSRRNEKWLDVPADSKTIGDPVCKMKKDVLSASNCRRISRTCKNDGVTYDCSYTKCDKVYGKPYRDCSRPVSKQTWRGCVGSRVGGLDERPEYRGTPIPGLLNVSCGKELQPLSNNMVKAKATIAGLKAQGDTYIPAGLAWGWRTLDDRLPLSNKTPKAGDKVEKVLVLMTDGENKRSKSGITHTSANTADANRKTEALCKGIKDSNIKVYTIAYDVTDKATKKMLQDCATDGANFFDAKNAKDLKDAFEDIAGSLNELRITA